LNLREQINAAVLEASFDKIETLVIKDKKTIRYLLGMTYQLEDNIQRAAAHGIGLAARHYPKLIKNILQRLVSSMDYQSSTNAYSAPIVLQAIARERPELLLPIVPDLIRLSQYDELHDGIADALCILVHACPGKLGNTLSKTLNKRIQEGKCCDGDD